MPDVYRDAASLLVIRRSADAKSPDGLEVLLLHKPRRRDAWQLPQGGVEAGETIEQAAVRELGEEAGITDVRILGTSPEVYKYDFPPSFRKFRPDNVCGQRIYFLYALVASDMQVNVDGKEIDRYQWVDITTVRRYVKRPEYLRLVERLYREAADKLKAEG